MSTQDPALKVTGLRKRFGDFEALHGLELHVPRGSVLGFIGPNGAGKTTAFSIIAGYLKADGGSIDILGKGPFNIENHRGRLGILPQDAALPESQRPAVLLRHQAFLQGLRKEVREVAVAQALEVAGLGERQGSRVRELSHGMRRRLQIASAFLGEPELVLLDEPTNGLDPVQARRVRGFISEQKGERSVVVSSHNLAELEQVCSHIVQIDRGNTIAHAALEDLQEARRLVRIWLGDDQKPHSALATALPNRPLSWSPEERAYRIGVLDGEEGDGVATAALRVLIQAGATIQTVQTRLSLEEALLGAENLGWEPIPTT